jgi:hypothetical protein
MRQRLPQQIALRSPVAAANSTAKPSSAELAALNASMSSSVQMLIQPRRRSWPLVAIRPVSTAHSISKESALALGEKGGDLRLHRRCSTGLALQIALQRQLLVNVAFRNAVDQPFCSGHRRRVQFRKTGADRLC